MKTDVKPLFLLVTLFSCMGSMQSLAQESFSISGTVDSYVDLLTGETFHDYSFSASIKYTPAAADETYLYAHMEQSFFYDSFSSIEYTIYDGDGDPIEKYTEIGDLNNITSVLNDLDLSDSITEQMYWYGDDPLSTVETQAVISFYDSTGNIVQNAEEYPTPPLIGEVDYGGAAFYRLNNDTGEGLEAWGRIAEVTFPNSSSDCAITYQSYQNRGQYIRCVVRVLRESRRNGGSVRGADLFSDFLPNNELRSAYSDCSSESGRGGNTFVKCFVRNLNGRSEGVGLGHSDKKIKKDKKSRKTENSRKIKYGKNGKKNKNSKKSRKVRKKIE